jgi:phosphate transport system substrate-binding protein
VEDTETSGRISIAAAPDVRALVVAEVEAFRAGYPQAGCTVRDPESSAQVLSALLAGRADVAAAGRDLEDEERRMARQNGIEIEGHRIAQDGMCVVVQSENPVRNATLGELQRVLRGELTSWSALGGRDARIVPVLPPLSSDLARAFVQRVMAGEPVRAAAMVETSDSAVAARVRATPGSFGVVPLSLATGDPRLRPLAIAAVEGAAYVDPDMESVHDGSYPLSHFVSLYIRTRGPRLAGGFVTFATSQPGQELVLASGRVPAAVPLRFVRRSPLLGSH